MTGEDRPDAAEGFRLVVAGGGTGGHIYPALSVAELLGPEAVDYVGSAGGPEARLVPAAGYRFHEIPTRKLRSGGPASGTLLRWAPPAAVAVGGALRSLRLLRSLRPDVVFGTGGYAAGPVILAAVLLRIPTLIHEGNAIPGRTNRLLARLVDRVAVTFEESRRFFPVRKTVVTGFPIRGAIPFGDATRTRALFGLDARPLLFAFGGSLGAESINRAVREALPLMERLGIQLLHQTGQGAAAGRGPDWYHPVPYVEAMADALAAAEAVVCRCGASTLSELTAVGRAAILVPYPHAHADHQTHNARALVTAGAAALVPDAELSGERLAREIERLMCDGDGRARMAEASRALGKPDAARRVLDEIMKLRMSAARRSRIHCQPPAIGAEDA